MSDKTPPTAPTPLPVSASGRPEVGVVFRTLLASGRLARKVRP